MEMKYKRTGKERPTYRNQRVIKTTLTPGSPLKPANPGSPFGPMEPLLPFSPLVPFSPAVPCEEFTKIRYNKVIKKKILLINHARPIQL